MRGSLRIQSPPTFPVFLGGFSVSSVVQIPKKRRLRPRSLLPTQSPPTFPVFLGGFSAPSVVQILKENNL